MRASDRSAVISAEGEAAWYERDFAAREDLRATLNLRVPLWQGGEDRAAIGLALARQQELEAQQARAELAEYLEGRRSFFTVPVDLSAAPAFQRDVLEVARAFASARTKPLSIQSLRWASPRRKDILHKR